MYFDFLCDGAGSGALLFKVLLHLTLSYSDSWYTLDLGSEIQTRNEHVFDILFYRG